MLRGVCYAVALEFQLPAITRKHFRFFLRPLAAILLPLLDGSRLMPAHSVALWEYYLKMNRPRSESSFEISDKFSKSTSSSFAITPMLALSPLQKEFEFELSHIPRCVVVCFTVVSDLWQTTKRMRLDTDAVFHILCIRLLNKILITLSVVVSVMNSTANSHDKNKC